jgi:hypothetical protein
VAKPQENSLKVSMPAPEIPPPSPDPSALRAGVLFTALLIAALLIYKNRAFIHDDAFITLRYAVNFAATGLPQWNPGEWAEGYTSLLHLSLEAGLIRLGLPPITAIYIVNGTALVALLTLTGIAARLVPHSTLATRTLTTLAVAATAPLTLWVLGGLEAILVATLCLAGLTCLLANLHRPRARFAALAALAFSCAILTRLDSAVFVAASGLGYLFSAPASLRKRLTTAVLVVGIPATVSLLHMAVRHSVYGELFPLTFYAKTDIATLDRLISGLAYLFHSLYAAPILGIAAIILFAGLLRHSITPAATVLLMPALAHICYTVWAGGDHMPAARILLPILAPLTLFVLAQSTTIGSRPAAALTALMVATIAFAAILRSSEPMDKAARVGRIIGQHIELTWPRGITIALNTAGSTPYFAGNGRVFIDMLGLNDPTIAKRQNAPILKAIQRLPGHAKGDGAYVLARKPDRIIIGPAEGTTSENAWFLSGTELDAMPEFHRCYEKRSEILNPATDTAQNLVFTYYLRTCTP